MTWQWQLTSRLAQFCRFRKSSIQINLLSSTISPIIINPISSTITHILSIFRIFIIPQELTMKSSQKSSRSSSKNKKNRSSKPKADTSSSSSRLSKNSDAVIKCDVENTAVAEFPRKPYPYLIFMEKYLKQIISKAKPFSVVLKMCGDEWKSMSKADKAHYDDEADQRTALYEKNMEGYTNWKSMSDAEKAPFIAKAKAPYLANIAELKKKLAEEGLITYLDDTQESDLTDLDENGNLDFFAYIAFSEESKKPAVSKKPAESKKPVESENTREEELAFKIFRNEHLGNYKDLLPDDQSVYAYLEGWYETCRVSLENGIAKLWDSANKASYIEKANAMAQESKKPVTKDFSDPMLVFCQDYITKYKKFKPNDSRLQNVDVNDNNWWLSVPADLVTNSYKLWNAMNDTQKAPYVTRAENILEEVLAFKIFRNEYLGNYKDQCPEDQSVYANSEGWYEKCPVSLEDGVTQLWESTNKASYIEKAKAMVHKSKNPAASKKPVTKDFSGPMFVFCQDYITKYKKSKPNDSRLQNVDVNEDNWWLSVPADLVTNSHKLWNAMNDTQKAPYVTRAENILEEVLAFKIFRNEYLGNYKDQCPEDQSVYANSEGWYEKCPVYLEDGVTHLWKSANKASYIDKAKAMVHEEKKSHL